MESYASRRLGAKARLRNYVVAALRKKRSSFANKVLTKLLSDRLVKLSKSVGLTVKNRKKANENKS